jgi:TRAP transporter TAXI family solute receptor
MVQLVNTCARRTRGLLVALLLLGLAACSPQPDAQQVQEVVQQQLDSALGSRVLQIEAFRRAGAQSLPGGDGRLVYFDAQLKLTRDYDFTQWDAHNLATLASLLGAGPRGVIGLSAEGNKAGDLIGVYGSAAFVHDGGTRWRAVPTTPAAAPERAEELAAAGASVRGRAREAPAPTAVEQALARLTSLLDAAPGDDAKVSTAQRDAIVTAAIEAAYVSAQAQLARAANTPLLAGGTPGGAYEQVAQALQARAHAAGQALDVLPSQGSVASVRMLADGEAEFAIVQSDIAAAAFAGRGPFGGAAQTGLRAVASLFPEAVQLVVRADGPIKSLSDLEGKRVDLGLPRSGTRANALAILAANDIALDALQRIDGHDLKQASARLVAGEIDALFATVHVPAPALQAAAAATPLAWIDLLPTDALRASGLVPLKLPARSYARQSEPVQTLAATALLVTQGDVSTQHVEQMLKLLFEAPAKPRSEGSAAAQIHLRTAREGVLIPWADAAQAFLDQAAR